jgi:hypothetical protein
MTTRLYTLGLTLFLFIAITSHVWGQPYDGEEQQGSTESFMSWAAAQVGWMKDVASRWQMKLESLWSGSQPSAPVQNPEVQTDLPVSDPRGRLPDDYENGSKGPSGLDGQIAVDPEGSGLGNVTGTRGIGTAGDSTYRGRGSSQGRGGGAASQVTGFSSGAGRGSKPSSGTHSAGAGRGRGSGAKGSPLNGSSQGKGRRKK